MKRLLPKGEFARNVLTVMSGTTIAQAIPVAISPILTRLYTPAELGVLALYVSVIAVGSVLATGRYELAVIIPRGEREAFDIVVLAVSLALFVCGVAWLGVAFFGTAVMSAIPAAGNLGPWLYVLPVSIFLTAAYQSLTYWSNRHKRYRMLATSKVGQSGAMCATQVGLGLAGAGPAGLIGGYVLGQIAANTLLARSLRRGSGLGTTWPSRSRVCSVARRHQDFPRFMIAGQLANVASSQMPVVLLSLLYGPAVAGFYSLAERVLVVPSSIIGSAIGDVYRQQAAQQYNATGNCRALYLRTARRLALIAIVPLLVVVASAPWLFSVLFGSTWREAGEITALLGGMVLFQVVSSPLSQTVLLAQMYRLDMIWQLARLVLAAGSLYVGYLLSESYKLSIILYVMFILPSVPGAFVHAVQSRVWACHARSDQAPGTD